MIQLIIMILIITLVTSYFIGKFVYASRLEKFRSEIKSDDICLYSYRDEVYNVKILKRYHNTCLVVKIPPKTYNSFLNNKYVDIKHLYPVEK